VYPVFTKGLFIITVQSDDYLTLSIFSAISNYPPVKKEAITHLPGDMANFTAFIIIDSDIF